MLHILKRSPWHIIWHRCCLNRSSMLRNQSLPFCFSISSCICTCLSIIFYYACFSFSLSLHLSLSKGQLVCFPYEEARNFLTWRKRSGTDTNMVFLWHRLHSKLLFLHLFVFLPFAPSLCLCSRTREAQAWWCLQACAYSLSTYGCLSVQWMGVRSTALHACECNDLFYLSIMWGDKTVSFLCQYYVCFVTTHHRADLGLNPFIDCHHCPPFKERSVASVLWDVPCNTEQFQAISESNNSLKNP